MATRPAKRGSGEKSYSLPNVLVTRDEKATDETDQVTIAVVRHLVSNLQGKPMDMRGMTAKEIAQNIELWSPLVRPYGCGPVAPADWLVLRTYQRIIEVRDEIRFDEMGLAIGDRTFKRCYQQALREIARFKEAGGVSKKMGGDNAEMSNIKRGIPPYKYDKAGNAEAFWANGDHIRSPTEAVEHAFKYLKSKFWHRYLFPFGCYFLTKSSVQSNPAMARFAERGYLLTSASASVYINPYSVTAADVLYLCNTVGYMERFLYIIGILIWAKRNGCNLLLHEGQRAMGNHIPRDKASREYFSMEKHLHVFGSIYMHRRVLENNKQDVGGNWTEMLEMLDRLETELMNEFGVDKNSLQKDFETMIIRKGRGTHHSLKTIFPSAAKVGDPVNKK